MARVELRDVVKSYPGGQRVVNGISLDIADREFLVLVGPSGCGKSTTLRMVAGLEEISGGTIRIGERVINDVPAKDRDIAMVFQNYALYPHMSVAKNMAFGLELRRKELGLTRQEIQKRVEEAARILGLLPYMDRKPKALSGGQRQRVAVGRAIVRSPQAFLFDEPLSNLDAKLRVETRAELKRLHQRLQTTTIYVTHDQEEAMTLGDRIVVMKEGRLQQCASPLEVYEHPVNQFVGSFVGTPPMNFIPGQVYWPQEDRAVFGWEGGGEMILPSRMYPALRGFDHRPMCLGIRPEVLRPVGGDSPAAGAESGIGRRIFTRIVLVEPLGEKVDLHLDLLAQQGHLGTIPATLATISPSAPSVSSPGWGRLICRADAYQFGNLTSGSIIQVQVDLSRIHLFEPGEEGRNVTLCPTSR